MKIEVLFVIVLLVIGSAGAGYFIGASNRGTTTSISSTTSSAYLRPPRLSILNASWVNSSGESGYCGTAFTGTGLLNPTGYGLPYAMCDVTILAGGSGTISLNISNSGTATGIAFDDVSSYPYVVYFAGSQGCMQSNAVGFCAIDANSTAPFHLTFLATPATSPVNYESINATLDVELGVLSSSS